MKRSVRLALFLLSLSLILTGFIGCGGSGGGGGGGSAVQTGYFTDGPVQGLAYSTATQSGTTDADGAFQYNDGEVVSFYVGDVLVGQATGAATLSPFDLAGITAPQTAVEVRRTINAMYRSYNTPTPIGQVINIAIFLQTLDDDGDLTNGIQIPDQMHTVATGGSLDFNQTGWAFPYDFALRKLIADGRAAGLWGGTRAIRNPAVALDSLYEGLGIVPEIYAVSSQSIDNNADGTVDSGNTLTFDTNGYPTMYELDNDYDGTVDERYTYAWNANGNQTMYERDSNADGVVDYRSTGTFDANGNQTMSEYDSNGDGTVDERYTNTYDANGNQTMSESDYNGDGTVDSRTTHTYDANGKQTMRESDTDADGIVDRRYTYTYDANGNRTMYERDSNADGTVDERYTNTYDANGNRTMEEYDSNADGTVDERETYTYDANGNETMYEYDSNADGTVD
jgi:hypothetical protein